MILTEGVQENVAMELLRETVRGSIWEGKVFVVGGGVRDVLLGKEMNDIDLLVNVKDGALAFTTWLCKKLGIFANDNPHYIEAFRMTKTSLAGVTYRGQSLDNVNIDTVVPKEKDGKIAGLAYDATKRDFTVNTVFMELVSGRIIDVSGHGLEDLSKGILVSAQDPNELFYNAPATILRAIRFAARYGWKISPEVKWAIAKNASMLRTVKRTKLKKDIEKIQKLDHKARLVAKQYMIDLGVHKTLKFIMKA